MIEIDQCAYLSNAAAHPRHSSHVLYESVKIGRILEARKCVVSCKNRSFQISIYSNNLMFLLACLDVTLPRKNCGDLPHPEILNLI